MPLHMRLPKLKGFRNRFRVEFQVVNVGDLGTLFPDGGTVGPEELAEAGAVRRNKPVKVLGNGDLGVALTVSAHAFSGSARDKITVRAARSPSCRPVDHAGPPLAERTGRRVAQPESIGSAPVSPSGRRSCVSVRAAVRVACGSGRVVGRRCSDGGLGPVVGPGPPGVSTGGCRCSALSGRP